MSSTRQPRDARALPPGWPAAAGSKVRDRADCPTVSDRDRLERTIEEQIIPRLMLMHSRASEASAAAAVPASPLHPQPEHVADLARLVIAPSVEPALAFVQGLRERGIPLERIYLELLVPTARLLGEMWNADYCSFTDVTIGLWRLQQLLHQLSPAFLNEAEPRHDGRRMLLVPEPGEQHTFGLIMVAEFFRRAGWEVWDQPLESRRELLEVVRRETFAVIGLSIGSDARLDSMAETIRQVRRVSRNPQIRVMVGGAPFVDRPDRVAEVGADSTATDGEQATRVAEGLLTAASASPS
jgi:methanogenic corrinoid protein MtbC1